MKSLRRLLTFWFVVAVLATLALASPVRAEEPEAPEPARTVLWALSGTSNTVYILGSIHLLGPEHYPLPPAMEAAYRDSQVVVFETDMEAMEAPAFQQEMLRRAMLPADTTLKEEVAPETWAFLEKRFADAPFTLAAFQRFRPWMCALTITMRELLQMGLRPDLGVDRHFWDRAGEDEKTRTFLERPEFQLDLLTAMEPEQEEQFLLETVRQADETRQEMRRLVRAWQTGDIRTLEDLVGKGFADYPDLEKRFLTDRNRAWIPRILEMRQVEENVLVVVGAAHLVGKDSVIDLLRRGGLRVEQK